MDRLDKTTTAPFGRISEVDTLSDRRSTMRTVTIETREVGQSFGTCAVIRDARTGRKLAETQDVRPHGFTDAAYRDGEALAEARGWTVRHDDES